MEPETIDAGEPTLQLPLRYHNLILDLGDVLCMYSHKDISSLPVPSFEMKNILNSAAWHEYERGKLTTEQCINALGKDYQKKPEDISASIEIMKQNIEWNDELVNQVRKYKNQANGQLRVFLMTNIAEPDFDSLKPTIESWKLFDGFFTSCAAGSRKPDSAFYQHILKEAQIDPRDTVFVDDKHENVTGALMAGMLGILFTTTDSTLRTLSQIFESGERKAMGWLEANAKQMVGRTNTDVVVHDQFAQLVILALTGRRDLVCIDPDATRTWNTFLGKPKLTSEVFPDDLDSTGCALMVLDVPEKTKHEVMDEMLTLTNAQGLFYTYFERVRLRVCAFVNANMLRLFFFNNRGHEVIHVVNYMTKYVACRAYRNGTRYFQRPDWVLWLLADLCAKCPDKPELQEMTRLLREQIKERMGTTQDPFSAALRVISAHLLGFDNQADLEILLRSQDADGGWSVEPWVYNWGRSGILFGHIGQVTALAWKALTLAGEEKIKKALERF